MSKDTVGAKLQALIPTSIDDVIRTNRDQASLRFSTQEDLGPLAGEILPGARAVPVSLWNFVTLCMHGEHPVQHVLLLGWNDNEDRTWNTSPVRRFDAAAGLVATRSGTIYTVAGPHGAEQDLDLVHLCIYLRQTGAGDFYGIPPFFY